MDEPTRTPSPNSLKCGIHNLRHGPAGCPICLRPPEVDPVVLLPVVDSSVGGREMFTDFLRRYGLMSAGLLTIGSLSLFTLGWPDSVRSVDPAPYRQEIEDLESVLFYAGPTDPATHHGMMGPLHEALIDSLKAQPPSYAAHDLTAAVEDARERWRAADPQTFRLRAPRKLWLSIRERFFDDAPWFRLRDDRLDTVQQQAQTGPDAPVSSEGALEVLESYWGAVGSFVARATYISSQACLQGSDKTNLASDFRALSQDTIASLDALVAGKEDVKAQLSPVITQVRTLVRGRKEPACGIPVPHELYLAREHESIGRTVERVRERLQGTGVPQ